MNQELSAEIIYLQIPPFSKAYSLRQGSANFFWKRPYSKYLLFLCAICLCSNYSTLPLQHKTSHRQCGSEFIWLSPKKFIFKNRQRTRFAHVSQFANLCSKGSSWQGKQHCFLGLWRECGIKAPGGIRTRTEDTKVRKHHPQNEFYIARTLML